MNHVASKLQLKKHIQVDRFGAALNCFTIASGMFLNDNNLKDYYFILDGDVYKTDDEKKAEIRKKLVGDDPLIAELQGKTLRSIFQYNLPDQTSPEKFIYLALLHDQFNGYQLDEDDREIIELVKILPLPSENHGFINDLIEQLGETREAGLIRIVKLLSKTSEWDNYIKPIKDFLIPYTSTLLEPTSDV